MNTIKILDKLFKTSISEQQIKLVVERIAKDIKNDLEGKDIVFVAILNGAFMFASDLFKIIDFPARITFLKLASYTGTSSTGNIKQLIGINEDLKNKTVVIIEDIVDTGYTLDLIIKQINAYSPKEIKVASLLYKPDALQVKVQIDYLGLEIPNDFIVGYGLDYNGFGRNLKEIYTLVT